MLDDEMLADDFASFLIGGLLGHPPTCDHCGLEMDTPHGHGIGVCVTGDPSNPPQPAGPKVSVR